MKLPKQVKIREVAPRDGFQSWPDFVPTEYKREIIAAAVESGIQEMETTSFVSPKAIPQMQDAAEVVKTAPRPGCLHFALVPNFKGAQLAIEAGVDGLVVVISSSEQHNMANVRRSIQKSIADLDEIFNLARKKNTRITGALAVAFGCPYQGDVSGRDVFSLAEAFVSRGADSLILADTTGMATPPRVSRLVQDFKDQFDVDFSLHFHNNRGTAMTNLYAALTAGATVFDTALGGIGGCPNVPLAAGNLPTEDVVYMLEDMGIATGINLVSLIKAAHLLEKRLGRTLPGQVMKSGPRDPAEALEICGHIL
ncbi:MAG: hydroxymethylglutaryl-CoA lyase [Desulfobacteraceae bacterium]|nr:hydroxymethylglutaryl-CoA lyase [Desulfobacteraceae bacterium]